MLQNKDVSAKYEGVVRGIVHADNYLKIAICDDEREYTIFLKRILLRELQGMNMQARIDTYTQSERLISCGETYDIIFLDIEMPDRNGLETASELKGRRSKIIFMTNYSEYIQEAYKVQPFRYLYKTDSEDKIREAVVDALLDDADRMGIMLELNGAHYYLTLKDVLYIRALGDEVEIALTKDEYIVRTTMKKMSADLSERFIRCSRSLLLNFQHIAFVEKDAAVLDDGSRFPIPVRERKKVKEEWHNYKKSWMWR